MKVAFAAAVLQWAVRDAKSKARETPWECYCVVLRLPVIKGVYYNVVENVLFF